MRTQRSIVMSVPLAALLAVGVGIVWAVLVIWVWAFVFDTSTVSTDYESLSFREDGVPIIERRNGTLRERRLLDGTAYTGPREFSAQATAALAGDNEFFHSNTNIDWPSRLAAFRVDANSMEYWYFLVDNHLPRSAWFEGFDGQTKQRLGYIGAKGYQPTRPRREDCFPLPDRIPVLSRLIPELEFASVAFYEAAGAQVVPELHLATRDAIHHVNLKSRKVITVANVPGLRSIGITMSALPEARDLSAQRKVKTLTWTRPSVFLVGRTADAIVTFDFDSHEPSSRFAIPEDLRSRTLLAAGGREPNVMALESFTAREDGTSDFRITWLRADGGIERDARVSLRQTQPRQGDIARLGMVGLMVPAPIAVLADAAIAAPLELVSAGFETQFDVAARRCLLNGWPVLVAAGFLSAGLAYVVYRRHRRLELPHAGIWAVFVFLGGVPGILGYWLHRAWPVCEPCETCREFAPRDRERCTECGEYFPAPERKGIEVYA